MRNTLAICTLAALLVACGDDPATIAAKKAAAELAAQEALTKADEEAIKSAIRKVLKDPDSARFGKTTFFDKQSACIEVNAKNSFGGYGGPTLMYVLKLGTWDVDTVMKEAQQNSFCRMLMNSKNR